MSHAISSARNSDGSMQRVSIGHSVSVSKHRNSPSSDVSQARLATRFSMRTPQPVSYTHLDVYKRQGPRPSGLNDFPLGAA